MIGPIAERLQKDGLINITQKQQLQTLRPSKQHIFEQIAEQQLTLADQRPLDSRYLIHWLSQWCHLPVQAIDPLRINSSQVCRLVSYSYASRFNILPLSVDNNSVHFATAEPFDVEWEQELAQLLKKRIHRVLARPEDIRRYLGEFYKLSHTVQAASKETFNRAEPNLEQLLQLGRQGQLDANNQHIVSVVDWLLQYAFEQQASDIHLEPRREEGRIRLRIDGVLHAVYQLPASIMRAVISRLKILGRLDLAEKRRPQDGRLKTQSNGEEIELRLSTAPTVFGEKLVLRIFRPETLQQDLHSLGFSRQQLRQWLSLLNEPNGILLVTGPTGSGKTSTLYSSLQSVASEARNLCTIEDPIELVNPNFNQMQVQLDIGLTFAAGIRALLRQDPDTIMIGEIRDPETAETAIQASLTGHLVMATMHTNDASATIQRLRNLGIAPYLIEAVFKGGLSQRLLRRLCPHCRQEGRMEDTLWQQLHHPWKRPMPDRIYHAKGCQECRQTGFSGRHIVAELLLPSAVLKRCIRLDKPLAELRQQAYRDGMQPMRLSALSLVAEGLTSLQEALEKTPAAEDLPH